MSNNIEQNGRQLATEQAAPPTDPRTRGLRTVPPTPESQRICRDFVWGICSMNEHCKYRHELDYESMRSILKFCHDYQNRTGCLRSECTYLHASREEENLFLTSGVIPRALAERYASMPAPDESTPEPLPPMMYMSEYISQPPPPPPPPPPNAQSSQPAPAPLPAPMAGPSSMGSQLMPRMTGPIHPAMTQMPVANMMPAPMPSARQLEQPSHSQMQQPPHSQMQQPSHSQMQQPSHSQMQQPSHSQMQQPSHSKVQLTVKTNMHAVMPTMAAPVPAPMPAIIAPPPPPPPPPTHNTAPTQMAAPAYTVAQPLQHSVPALYPITPCSHSQPSLQPMPQIVLFDPSRPPPPIPVKRPAPTEPEAGPSKVLKLDEGVDNVCETCVEQNLRTALEQQDIEKLQREEEYRRRIYDQKTEEYENGNMLMRSLLGPQMFRVVEEFLDIAQTSDLFSAGSSPTYSNSSSATSVPKQFMFQLMEFLLSKRNADQHTSPLDLLTRRSTSQTELMFASLLELFQNGVTADTRISPLDLLGTNGLGRMSNGPLERLSNGPLERLSNGPMERLSNGPMERLSNGPLERLELVPPAARYPPPAPRYPPPAPRYPASAPPYVPTNQGEVVPPTAPYQAEPVPQPMYVPYQAAPAPAPAAPPAPTPTPTPAPAPQPHPYYHPYPGSSTNMSAGPYASTSSAPPPAQGAAPAPAPPHYQYLGRMPHHYYPPFQ